MTTLNVGIASYADMKARTLAIARVGFDRIVLQLPIGQPPIGHLPIGKTTRRRAA